MKECRGELLQRIRQGVASAQEQTAFEAHLRTCESCLMTLDVMNDLDAIGEPEPGDSERVARMADAGVAAFGKKVVIPRRSARRTWQLAVAAMVLTGAAAAGVVVTRLSPDPPSDTAQASPAAPQAPPVANSPQKTTPPEPTARDAPESTEATPAVPAPKVANPTKSAPPASAKETYRAANEARRAGKTSEAIRGYQKLQQQFPSSPEAYASRVSLGGLLLRSGSSGAALAQFNAYLASSGGQLTAEALFGRAQALRALGRAAEEAQNLERLVTTYPNSAYATHAQRRLLELR